MTDQIDKVSAAVRQIDAAIRILFAGEDILVVHTIADAVHSLLTELAKNRGISLPSDETLDDLHREHSPNNPRIPEIKQFKKEIYRKIRKPGNFLKHADRDANESLILKEKETANHLMECCLFYKRINDTYTPEMEAFLIWYEGMYFKNKSFVGYVKDLPPEGQLHLGRELIKGCHILALQKNK